MGDTKGMQIPAIDRDFSIQVRVKDTDTMTGTIQVKLVTNTGLETVYESPEFDVKLFHTWLGGIVK